MHTPKKKKSEEGFYPRTQSEDCSSPSFHPCGYNCLTQINEETTYYNHIDKRIILNNNLINFNVGGTKYTTTLSTLSNDRNSNLYKYAYLTLNGIETQDDGKEFNGYFNITDSNSGGLVNIFIDRDGKTFQFVLNYLRDGDLICPDDPFIYQSILSDAKFYKLDKLVDIICKKLDKPPQIKLYEPEKELESLSQHSENTQLEFSESIPLTQFTNGDLFFAPHNVFLRIEENDNIEESSQFVQTTPIRLLGKEEFSTSVDF